MRRDKAKIAIATGDPAGIGPEISLKAALDPVVSAACDPILVSDPGVLAHHAKACGIVADIRMISRVSDADFSAGRLNVLDCKQPDAAKLDFGATNPIAGRASIAFVGAAVNAALAGEVDAVVGAPQNETSIAQAGIAFDGHPSFVAHQTGIDENGVFMMLCFGNIKVAHATLHQSVRKAIESITKEKVTRVIDAADTNTQADGHRHTDELLSAGSIHTPAKADYLVPRKSKSSSRRSTRLWRKASRCQARSAPTPCFI